MFLGSRVLIFYLSTLNYSAFPPLDCYGVVCIPYSKTRTIYYKDALTYRDNIITKVFLSIKKRADSQVRTYLILLLLLLLVCGTEAPLNIACLTVQRHIAMGTRKKNSPPRWLVLTAIKKIKTPMAQMN